MIKKIYKLTLKPASILLFIQLSFTHFITLFTVLTFYYYTSSQYGCEAIVPIILLIHKNNFKNFIMKKLFITVVLAIAVAAVSSAAPKKVSSAILANFHSQFKEASDVTWLVTNDYTKAAFTADNTSMEVYYNPGGDIIGTSKSIIFDELPANARKRFDKKFSGYEVKEVIRFEGFDEAAYYISGENEKETIIIKVTNENNLSVFKKTKK